MSWRKFFAVLAGVAAWALLWNAAWAGAQAAVSDLVQPDRPVTHGGLLLAFVVYGTALSVLAGAVTASIARPDPMRTVWALAILQLGLGVVAEISYWSLMPVWYHAALLAPVIPATVLGGRLVAGRIARVAHADARTARA